MYITNTFCSLLIVLSLAACSAKQTNTPQPIPAKMEGPTAMATSILFERYGIALTDIPYCSADPVQRMDMYFPDSGGPWPVLVYVHGGSWMHGENQKHPCLLKA